MHNNTKTADGRRKLKVDKDEAPLIEGEKWIFQRAQRKRNRWPLPGLDRSPSSGSFNFPRMANNDHKNSSLQSSLYTAMPLGALQLELTS